jgi:hypothetical protein
MENKTFAEVTGPDDITGQSGELGEGPHNSVAATATQFANCYGELRQLRQF